MPAEAAWCRIFPSTSSARRRRKREAANEARPHRRRCHRPGVVALSVTYGSLFTIYQTGQALSAQRAPEIGIVSVRSGWEQRLLLSRLVPTAKTIAYLDAAGPNGKRQI